MNGFANFRGKTVLVTGAAAGIGRATALAFAREGANLVVSDLVGARLLSLAAEIEPFNVRCHSKVVDVADEGAMREFAEWVRATVGAVDVLVNNAGIGFLGSFRSTPTEQWRRVLDVNLMGVVHGCLFFTPAMLAAGGPRRIVNVASLAGIAPMPNLSAYSASKHAVMGLTDSLRLELDGTGIGVTAVCPGVINTEIMSHRENVAGDIADAQVERLQAYYAKHGVGPEVVARSIVDGVRAGRDLVLVGPYARPLYHLKRLSRRWAQRFTIEGSRRNGYL